MKIFEATDLKDYPEQVWTSFHEVKSFLNQLSKGDRKEFEMLYEYVMEIVASSPEVIAGQMAMMMMEELSPKELEEIVGIKSRLKLSS